MLLSIGVDHRNPPIPLRPILDTSDASLIPSAYADVGGTFRAGAQPQIGPSIVCFASVDVINNARRPFPRHQDKNNPMRHVGTLVVRHLDVSSCL